MNIFALSISMILIFTLLITIILFKSKEVNLYNFSIYIIIFSFWIVASMGMKITNISTNGVYWKWPILFASFHLIQFLIRLPLGKLSQVIRSRKVVISMMAIIMILFSIPCLIRINFISLFFMSLGLGSFAATTGMQNQYWSENFNIKKVFLTTGIMIIPIFTSRFMAIAILEKINNINEFDLKIIIASIISFAFINLIIYIFFHKENKETILLDNQGEYSIHVSKMKLREIIVISIQVAIISFIYTMINNSQIIKTYNFSEFQPLILAIISIVILIGVFVLIKFFSAFSLTMSSTIMLIIGIALLLIGNFMNIPILNLTGYILFIIGSISYIGVMFGVMLHFDHKNSLLVLGIWLTIKSLFLGVGMLIGKNINHYFPEEFKYLLIPSLILILVSTIYSIYKYKSTTKEIFNVANKLEKIKENHISSKIVD